MLCGTVVEVSGVDGEGTEADGSSWERALMPHPMFHRVRLNALLRPNDNDVDRIDE